jgi:hypothetical protein
MVGTVLYIAFRIVVPRTGIPFSRRIALASASMYPTVDTGGWKRAGGRTVVRLLAEDGGDPERHAASLLTGPVKS